MIFCCLPYLSAKKWYRHNVNHIILLWFINIQISEMKMTISCPTWMSWPTPCVKSNLNTAEPKWSCNSVVLHNSHNGWKLQLNQPWGFEDTRLWNLGVFLCNIFGGEISNISEHFWRLQKNELWFQAKICCSISWSY